MTKRTDDAPEILRDIRQMREKPENSRFHWLFSLLLILAVGAALWQHGNFLLTLILMAAIPAVSATIHLPYRIFPALARSIVKSLLFCFAIIWGILRAKNTLPDLILVEGLSICSLCFLMGGKHRNYGYVFFISLFLLLYGALIPRGAYLLFSGIGFLLVFLILWAQRSHNLAKSILRRETPIRRKRLWIAPLLQIIPIAIFFWLTFSMMPLQNNEVKGWFETTFSVDRQSTVPPEFQTWIRPQKVLPADSKPTSLAAKNVEKASLVSSQDGDKTMQNGKGKSAIEGFGSAQGHDLVFVVNSPLKLYHLARLYDTYDGSIWKASKRLQQIRIRDHRDYYAYWTIDLRYRIEKMLSLHLYSPYMPTIFSREKEYEYQMMTDSKSYFYGTELLNTPHALPFNYMVSVQLPVRKNNPEVMLSAQNHTRKAGPDPAWNENIAKSHYLTLPRGKKISSRVRSLAKRITAGKTTSYQKAIALRDYLRTHYQYELQAQPLPPGRETADFFLFDAQRGHCEYFASVLAILARLNGLPARVATGFSPGNYNSLNGTFEVYENHAHAWTQIYIDSLGWLTMDATPPSNISSNIYPPGIGQLRDPFGDEWRITPPEITQANQQVIQQSILKEARKNQPQSMMDKAIIEVVEKQEKLQNTIQEKYEESLSGIDRSKKSGWLGKLENFQKAFLKKIQKTGFVLYDFLYSYGILILTAVLFLIVLFHFCRSLFCILVEKWEIRRIRKMQKQSEKLMQQDPNQALLQVYHASLLALKVAGFPRNNQELLAYSDWISAQKAASGNRLRIIFLLFYKIEYGQKTLSETEAQQAVEALKGLLPVLLPGKFSE